MRWQRSWRFDPRAAALADRHYNRQTIGAPQFSPPGRMLALLTPAADAVWVTTWQLPEYTRHGLGDAWICTLFRNEGAALSSELVREALAATRAEWGDPPDVGTFTFVDPRQVASTNPGYCFLMAGFVRLEHRTKDRGLVILQLPAAEHPAPAEPLGYQARLDFCA